MLEIAMALRLKGMADAAGVGEAVGLSADEVAPVFAEMVAAGHASETPRGHRLTPEGKTWLDGLLDAERAGIDTDAMNAVYERFCEHNDDFKQLVTDWQVKIVDGEQVMNDHSDEAYDQAIFARLADLDEEVTPVFADAAALAPRISRYLDRFAAALAALQGGDHTMLAAPLKDSYHTVWFEMHEELILLSGRNRADEAAAGRGA
jgi:pyruvate,orthophosphate dikinase